MKCFIHGFLSCINDYIEDMTTFTALAKIYSTKYFCDTKVAGLGEILSSENLRLYSIYILFLLFPLHDYTNLMSHDYICICSRLESLISLPWCRHGCAAVHTEESWKSRMKVLIKLLSAANAMVVHCYTTITI